MTKFVIYKVTNVQNNKCYIGQTSKALNYRKRAHENCTRRKEGFLFHKAIRRHGTQHFKWEVLGYCKSKEEADNAEIICIEFFQSNDRRYGYNIHSGGNGGNSVTPENRERFCKAVKNALRCRTKEEKRRSLEKRKKTYLENNIMEKQVASFKKTLSQNPEIKRTSEKKRQKTINEKYDNFYKEMSEKRMLTEKANPDIQIQRSQSYKKTLRENPEILKNKAEMYKLNCFLRTIIQEKCNKIINYYTLDPSNLDPLIELPSNRAGGLLWLQFFAKLDSIYNEEKCIF